MSAPAGPTAPDTCVAVSLSFVSPGAPVSIV